MSTPTPFTQGVMMCAVSDTWTTYTQATVDLFEVLEQVDPSPALVDAAFERARVARINWNALWEGEVA